MDSNIKSGIYQSDRKDFLGRENKNFSFQQNETSYKFWVINNKHILVVGGWGKTNDGGNSSARSLVVSVSLSVVGG